MNGFLNGLKNIKEFNNLKTNKIMTTVEWLEEELNNIKSSSTKNSEIKFLENEFNGLLQQAKEREEQQQCYSESDLKNAFFSGCQSERQIKPRIKCWEEWFEQNKKK